MTVTSWLIPVATTWSGRVFGDLWPATIFSFIMAEAHQVHQRDIRDDQNVTLLMSFFLTEGNKKILIHKEKSRFPFSATAHRDFEIFKKAVLDFCGVQSLAEAKGLGRSIDCSFMRTVRSGTVESFCIRTQKQWENEMALLLERNSILQGMLTLAL